jgi:hypothetical protein
MDVVPAIVLVVLLSLRVAAGRNLLHNGSHAENRDVSIDHHDRAYT